MGIEANLQVDDGEFLPLEDDLLASKVIANFCTSALVFYCDVKLKRFPDATARPEDHVLLEWFSALDSKMTTNICLLSDAVWGFWDYSKDDYARYADDTRAYLATLEHPESSPFPLYSEADFLETCARAEQTWTDVTLFRQTVDDLVRGFGLIQSAETWWYHPTLTPKHFRALSKTLALAKDMGYSRARLNCE